MVEFAQCSGGINRKGQYNCFFLITFDKIKQDEYFTKYTITISNFLKYLC